MATLRKVSINGTQCFIERVTNLNFLTIREDEKGGRIELRGGAYVTWTVEEVDGEIKEIFVDEVFVPAQERRAGKGRALLREALVRINGKIKGRKIPVTLSISGTEEIDTEILMDFFGSEGFSLMDLPDCPSVVMEWDGKLSFLKRPGRKKKDPHDPSRAESRPVTLKAEEWARLEILSKGNALKYVADLAREDIRRMGGGFSFDDFTREEVVQIVENQGHHIHYQWQIAYSVYDDQEKLIFEQGKTITFEELLCEDGWEKIELHFLGHYTEKAKKAFRTAFEKHANILNFNPNQPPCGGRREPCAGRNKNPWEMPWLMKGAQYIDMYTDTPEESGRKWAVQLLEDFRNGKGFICRMCEID